MQLALCHGMNFVSFLDREGFSEATDGLLEPEEDPAEEKERRPALRQERGIGIQDAP
jgi:hypothetical protein